MKSGSRKSINLTIGKVRKSEIVQEDEIESRIFLMRKIGRQTMKMSASLRRGGEGKWGGKGCDGGKTIETKQ